MNGGFQPFFDHIRESFSFSNKAHHGGIPHAGSPYKGQPGEVIDPTKVKVYRGGTSFELKPGEVKIVDGKVLPTKGVSLDTSAVGLEGFGGAKRIVSIPDELQIIQRGQRATHFEIVPKQPMTLEHYEELLRRVVIE